MRILPLDLVAVLAVFLLACRAETPASLVALAHAGKREAVNRMLSEGADPDAIERGVTPLFAAVVANRGDVVELLLARGARIGVRMPEGPAPTLLHYLAAGGGVAAPTPDNKTGLMYLQVAARRGSPERARALYWTKRLLEHAPDVKDALAIDIPYVGTPLHAAASSGDPEIVRVLLAAGADPTLRSRTALQADVTPLIAAIIDGEPDVIRALVPASPPPEADDCARRPILASLHRRIPFDSRSAVIDALGARRDDPEMDGACRPHWLRQLGVDADGSAITALEGLLPTQLDARYGGATVVEVAVWTRDAAVLEYLVRTKLAMPGHVLVLAAADGWDAHVREALASAAAAGSDCRAGLIAAARHGHVAVVKAFVEASCPGAGEGWNAALADAALNVPLFELLHAAGATIDAVSEFGETALHRAARAGDSAAVDWLLAHGADPSRAITGAATPPIDAAHCAQAAGHGALAERLRAHPKSTTE